MNDLPVSREDYGELVELISAAKSGSKTAMSELIKKSQRYLLSLANKEVPANLRPKASPSDLVQETMLDGWRLFDRFTGDTPEDLFRWLRAIFENKLRNAWQEYEGTQKRSLSREQSLEGMGPDGNALDPADDGLSPSGTAVAKEEKERLFRTLATMPSSYAEVIRLRNLENLSFVEIGDKLKLSKDAARMLWVRAIKLLTEKLSESQG